MENTEKLSTRGEKEGSAEKQPGEFEKFDPTSAKRAVEDKREEIKEQHEAKLKRLLDRAEQLKAAKVPDGKFKMPAECFDGAVERIKAASEDSSSGGGRLFEGEIDHLEKIDGTIDRAIGERLWSLYSDPDISVGIHGTVDEAGSELWSEGSSIFKDGLGCAYSDLRRTVAFQDRGRVHAHGSISFLDLLSYNHPSSSQKQPLKVKKLVEHKERVGYGTHAKEYIHWEEEEAPAKQYSVVVAIPKNVSTTDPALRGKEMTVKGSNGKPKRTIALKGEFIVGIISDSDPNTIIWNPSFDSQRVKEFGNQREQEIKEDEAKRKEAEKARQAQTGNDEPAKLGWFKRLFGGAKK